MQTPEQYRQTPLDLTQAGASARADTPAPEIAPATPDTPIRPLAQFHTQVPSNRPIAGEAWNEYILEAETRADLGLPAVSPAEFAAMTDWQYRFPTWREAVDGDDEPGGAYGPSVGYDALPDAPRDEQFRRDGGTVFDARKARLDATIDLLARQVEQIVTGDGYRDYLKMLSRFHTYSANNVALILAQYPDATRVMGFGNKAGTTGWKSLGRHVRKGETGIRIIRPVHKAIEDAESGERKQVLIGFTAASVFDVSQTEGIPLPVGPKPQELTGDEHERSLELRVGLHRLIDERGVRVVRDHETTKAGWWSPTKREIGIRADLSGVRELKVLAHETAHMLADHRRENIAEQDAETVAESVAFVLLDHHGIDTSTYSVPYIAGWARSAAVVQRNLDAVRTLSNALLLSIGDGCPPDDEPDMGEAGGGGAR